MRNIISLATTQNVFRSLNWLYVQEEEEEDGSLKHYTLSLCSAKLYSATYLLIHHTSSPAGDEDVGLREVLSTQEEEEIKKLKFWC